MKKFRRLSMTLFDSSNANFKITLESQFTSGSQQTGFRDRVYVTDKESGILNSSIFLTFTYKSEDAEPIYTSYPQIFKLRETFKKVIDNGLVDGSAFINDNGALSVRPDHADPINITNIGKDNNWISIRYAVANLTNEEVSQPVPAVSIELSKSNHYASVLTVDEFLSVYAILCDVNLPSLQCMMALAYLDTPTNNGTNPYTQPQGYPYGGAPQTQGYVAPTAPYGAQPMNNGYNGGWQYGDRPAPRYGQGSRNSYRTTQTPPPAAGNNPAPAPVQSQSTKAPQGNPMPPREQTKPIMTQKAIEDTPISEVSFDDSEALNGLFDNE